MGEYSVYKHTFPNGRVYIGITGTDPERRWDSGKGYSDNEAMFSDIVAFGWNNVRHDIVATGLTKSEASELERSLIVAQVWRNGLDGLYNKQHANGAPLFPYKVQLPGYAVAMADSAGVAQWELVSCMDDADRFVCGSREGDMRVFTLCSMASRCGYDVMLVRRSAVEPEYPIRIDPTKQKEAE